MYIPSASESDVPFSFRMARAWYAFLKGWRGEYWLHRQLSRTEFLDRAGRFTYFGKQIYVPLKVPETLFVYDFSLFHALRELNFAHELNESLPGEFTLIDCGAYYGQVSMRIAQLCPALKTLLAVEANSDSCTVLKANLKSSGKDFHVFDCALSDRNGKGKLRFPKGPDDPDSAFLEFADDGAINVRTVDDLVEERGLHLEGANVALKLDVEGQEKAVVHGARKLIGSAGRVCLFVELHPEALARAETTAEGLLGAIDAIRPMRWYLADRPWLTLDATQPVFEQIGSRKPCDVIGVSK